MALYSEQRRALDVQRRRLDWLRNQSQILDSTSKAVDIAKLCMELCVVVKRDRPHLVAYTDQLFLLAHRTITAAMVALAVTEANCRVDRSAQV